VSRPTSEDDALALVQAAERLGGPDVEWADRLHDLFFFLPAHGGRQLLWPDLWLRAARVLAGWGRLDRLRDVAESPEPHYLGAVGALALAESGELGPAVRDWLRSTRDYHLLTSGEQTRLAAVLARLDDTERERAVLARLSSDG
jgi:hypothetical protein